MLAGGGGRVRAWGGDLIVFVGPGGRAYLNLSSPDVRAANNGQQVAGHDDRPNIF